MKSRLWYPQLDIPSAARRFLRILFVWNEIPPSIERLLIIDFFLASPALIGDIKMPTEFRKKYSSLHFPKRKDQFVVFPNSSLLFHSMIPMQKKALISLAAKGLVDREKYDIGKVLLTNEGKETAQVFEDLSQRTVENQSIQFLCELLASSEFSEKIDLRSRTGLRYYD